MEVDNSANLTPRPRVQMSREMTPSLTPSRKKNINSLSRFLTKYRVTFLQSKFFLIILLLLCLISFIFAMISSMGLQYCDDEGKYTVVCKKCPENSKCKNGKFICDDGYKNFSDVCLITTMSDEDLLNDHQFVKNTLNNKTLTFLDVQKMFNTSFNDTQAIIFYKDDLMLSTDNIEESEIIRKPPPMNPLLHWQIFVVFFIASIILLWDLANEVGQICLLIVIYLVVRICLPYILKSIS